MTKKLLMEKQIEILAKKLNNFTLSDVEILVEKPKMDIIPMLEQMVNKGKNKTNIQNIKSRSRIKR